MKFSDLQAKRTGRDRQESYVNEMPVISTRHIPFAERHTVLDWGEDAPLITAYRIEGRNLILRVTDLEDDDADTFQGYGLHVLFDLMRQCAAKGFTNIQLSPDGYEFPDLPHYVD